MEACPGCLAPYEKLLSYSLLALVAHLSAEQVTAFWADLPHTPNMLADKVVAAALCTLHPSLFKLLQPAARNQRLVCRIAFTLWDLTESVLQYAAARALIGPDGLVGRVAYADSPFAPYWAFDDPTLVTIAVGPPGRRRWHELEHAGPRAVWSDLGQKKGQVRDPAHADLVRVRERARAGADAEPPVGPPRRELPRLRGDQRGGAGHAGPSRSQLLQGAGRAKNVTPLL